LGYMRAMSSFTSCFVTFPYLRLKSQHFRLTADG
jgi:hypothetical protein